MESERFGFDLQLPTRELQVLRTEEPLTRIASQWESWSLDFDSWEKASLGA